MIHFERSLEINAPKEVVWAVLGRFMHVDEIAPEIVSVDALTEGNIGVGSKRRNHFKNGTSLVEEVTEWKSGEAFTVKLSEMDAMPLHEASSTVFVTPKGLQSKVTWTFDYHVKYGPLGWLMGQTLMKMMMGKIIDANLKGLEEKVLQTT